MWLMHSHFLHNLMKYLSGCDLIGPNLKMDVIDVIYRNRNVVNDMDSVLLFNFKHMPLLELEVIG